MVACWYCLIYNHAEKKWNLIFLNYFTKPTSLPEPDFFVTIFFIVFHRIYNFSFVLIALIVFKVWDNGVDVNIVYCYRNIWNFLFVLMQCISAQSIKAQFSLQTIAHIFNLAQLNTNMCQDVKYCVLLLRNFRNENM